jgi:hypothetical protein
VTRALLRDAPLKTLLPIALIFLSCAGLYFGGDDELAGEIFVVASVVLAVFLFAGWRMHWRALREKMAAARGRFFMAHLRDEGIVIDGLAPEALLEWKNIKAIWQLNGVWLLILATNRFIALPLASAPQDALDFLQAQVLAHQKQPNVAAA